MQAFEQKGTELVSSLANQLISLFEQQNEALTRGLQSMTDSLLQTLPRIIGEEIQKALTNVNGNNNIVESTGEEEPNSEEPNTENPNAEFDCSVCQDTMINPKSMQCGHTFCSVCINTWLQHSKFCPICRQAIEKDEEDYTWDDLVMPDSDDDL